MKLSQFRFDLPLNLIAQKSTKRREDSRMMVVHPQKPAKLKTNILKTFWTILMIKMFLWLTTQRFSCTYVSRKKKTGARIEVFLLRELNKPNRLWDVIVDPARKLGLVTNYILVRTTNWLLKQLIILPAVAAPYVFLWDDDDESFKKMLEFLGETPLPKYIKRKPDEEDRERYQTVYAKHEGAVAALLPDFTLATN